GVARAREAHGANGRDVRLETGVVAIDVDARTVTARGRASGAETVEPFDDLGTATGWTPVRPDLPGIHARGVHAVQHLGDGIDLRADLVAIGDGWERCVVVGGGYVGLELAEALHDRGRAVTIIEAASQPMDTLDPDIGALVADAIRSLGIELITGTRVEAFDVDGDGRVRGVVAGERTIACNLVVLGLGVAPSVQLARDAGVRIGPSGGIATHARMATSVAGGWAVRDGVDNTPRRGHRRDL